MTEAARGAWAGRETFTYDNEGQLATGHGAGYAFDYEHRLTGVGSVAQYRYDGIGNRLEATRNNVTTRYVYDLHGNLIAEADAANTITRYYIHGLGLMSLVTPVGQTYCYHFNQIGSTVAMTDMTPAMVNQYAYTPFGAIANQTETIAQPFTFVGQMGVMTEPNGFYYMRARYYDPGVRRFISEDPIGFEGGDLNLYAYVGNNPANRNDPLGLYWFRQFWQTPGVVGSPGTLVEPGDAVSELIERNVPAGYTFGEMHDGLVDFTAPDGSASWRRWLTNIPSMPLMYVAAVGVEVLRTLGILDQPAPPGLPTSTTQSVSYKWLFSRICGLILVQGACQPYDTRRFSAHQSS